VADDTQPTLMSLSYLGPGFDTADSQIMEEPVLPEFLDEVVLRRLAMGGSCIDVSLRRAGPEVVFHILDRNGDVRVLTLN
jgi:hypothetical protein